MLHHTLPSKSHGLVSHVLTAMNKDIILLVTKTKEKLLLRKVNKDF